MRDKANKTIKTRDLLIQTAGKQFTLHGVKGVQAKDIAREAGTVPNAITYHFGGLDNLVDAVWEHALNSMNYAELEVVYAKTPCLNMSNQDINNNSLFME